MRLSIVRESLIYRVCAGLGSTFPHVYSSLSKLKVLTLTKPSAQGKQEVLYTDSSVNFDDYAVVGYSFRAYNQTYYDPTNIQRVQWDLLDSNVKAIFYGPSDWFAQIQATYLILYKVR